MAVIILAEKKSLLKKLRESRSKPKRSNTTVIGKIKHKKIKINILNQKPLKKIGNNNIKNLLKNFGNFLNIYIYANSIGLIDKKKFIEKSASYVKNKSQTKKPNLKNNENLINKNKENRQFKYPQKTFGSSNFKSNNYNKKMECKTNLISIKKKYFGSKQQNYWSTKTKSFTQISSKLISKKN